MSITVREQIFSPNNRKLYENICFCVQSHFLLDYVLFKWYIKNVESCRGLAFTHRFLHT